MAHQRTDDVRIEQGDELLAPMQVMRELAPTERTEKTTVDGRRDVHDILRGADDRLIAVVGPCSIHDSAAALDYAKRLARERERLRHDLAIVMRVYFEKPRTTVGWKGFINDPRLDESFDMNEGLRLARKLLLEIDTIGVPCGTEFLDLISPQYIADLIAWGAIGARTTESQSHRQLASGLSCPVGFKNGTDGGIKVAADAILAANASHAFMGMTKMGQAAIFETRGNADCHVILRGGKAPNYKAPDVTAACAALAERGLREQVMIDFSHANSEKKHQRQIDVGADVAAQIAAGDARITGVMIESHLADGRQDLKPGVTPAWGVSITDACIGWADTEPLLARLAQAVRARRAARR